MKIIDRYIIRQFLLNYIILTAVMMALIITLDFISNIDEFVSAADKSADQSWLVSLLTTASIFVKFYAPRSLLYYVYLAGLLPFGAAAFTLAQLSRNRELVAMLAGGVSLFRAALPILAIGACCCLLQFVDQQFVLPRLADQLFKGHSDLKHGYRKSFGVYFAPDTNGSLFTAAQFDTDSGDMRDVTILLRDANGREKERITASQASWDPVNHGWKLTHGIAVRRLTTEQIQGSAGIDRRITVSFVPSDLDPVTILLRRNASFRQLLSLQQISALMNKPQIVDVRDLQRIRQSRFSLLVMNLLILTMGMSFYMSRAPGNLLAQTIKAAPLCLGAWGGGFVMLQIGPESLPPAAIAWLGVLIYLPIAFLLMDRVET